MRPEKMAVVQAIRGRVGDSGYVLLADYRGMNVEAFGELRRQLDKGGAQIHVYKNRLLRVVAAERNWTAWAGLLRGQSAIVTGGDAVRAAKALRQFAGEGNVPAVRGGMLGEAFLTPADVVALAEIPSPEVLRASLVGTLAAPLRRVAGVLKQTLGSVVSVLKAVEQKKSAA
jgi:large subunit ribosomal protein L10